MSLLPFLRPLCLHQKRSSNALDLSQVVRIEGFIGLSLAIDIPLLGFYSAEDEWMNEGRRCDCSEVLQAKRRYEGRGGNFGYY